jgi:hypothetical protein
MKSQRGGIEFLILAIVILASFILVGGTFTFINSLPQNNGQPVNVTDVQPGAAQNSLQLKSLKGSIPSPTPTITTACNHDNGQPAEINDGIPVSNPNCLCPEYLINCQNQQCVSATYGIDKIPTNCSATKNWCSNHQLSGGIDGVFCIGKPVIYLYPVKDTLVNVKLDTPGKIVESIPSYTNEGWNNILAHSNGSFEYKGKTYNELYYESSVTKVEVRKEGFVVTKSNAEEQLKTITYKLGLIKPEQEEFLNYWLPKINSLSSKYIFISIISPNEKERIDKVEINPQPDTRIEFLVYFKPVENPYTPAALILPQNPPKRNGFTEVEWGGTINGN